MDHDRLFKELLSNFFEEFVDLFLPDVSAYLDKDAEFIPMDKEVFTDITLGDKHEVDLLMKVKFRGKEAFFLIHVENQATPQSDFPKRMFRYFARLIEKYDLPVYPVVIFSFDSPLRQEPNRYEVAFPGKTVLKFEYEAIQLNRLPWRRFIHQHNPVACALMAKMKMTPKDRPKVKLECLRLLASLKLDPARSKLIGGFIDAYLDLSTQEMAQYERELAEWDPSERTANMELISSWERTGIEKGLQEGLQLGMQQGVQQGMQQGVQQGKEELLEILLEQRFSTLPSTITQRLDQLTSEQMNNLGKVLFDFTSLADLEKWLDQY